jgi:hypothetical protein
MLISNTKRCYSRHNTGALPQHQAQVRTPSPVSPTRRRRYHLTTHDDDRGGCDEVGYHRGHTAARHSECSAEAPCTSPMASVHSEEIDAVAKDVRRGARGRGARGARGPEKQPGALTMRVRGAPGRSRSRAAGVSGRSSTSGPRGPLRGITVGVPRRTGSPSHGSRGSRRVLRGMPRRRAMARGERPGSGRVRRGSSATSRRLGPSASAAVDASRLADLPEPHPPIG